ncbi:zf-CCCH domain-containing protein [Cephalotus follicularis]|uniref:Zf-CCCH domain-containing protein n=1 Tax=Cephalotus follicularis TaxID=3775 RepID=A0A1Q3DA28_CEPFO|nr:zf-CCCH domain-containing protein [Cephalotus follicularis]
MKGVNPSLYDLTSHRLATLNYLNPNTCKQDAANVDLESIYSSDEFRMYAFKIKKCTRTRSHDWTECPYAHRGEKAQRRDPRKMHYSAIACPAFRNGKCNRGDACEFAHGVFEYWLHPARYRTRACHAGRFCQRKVCFFAHTPEQLRTETKYKCRYAYRPRLLNTGRSATSSPLGSDFLMGLSRGVNIRDDDDSIGFDGSDFDLPDIDWISDLVN